VADTEPHLEPETTGPPVARTRDEAIFFMDLQPCPSCGEHRTPWSGELVDENGLLRRRYTGTCSRCGDSREFVFAMPERAATGAPGPGPRFGGPEPSRLIDPGQWLALADGVAAEARAATDPAQARRPAELATACVAEVAKFIPDGATHVPESACWTPAGREYYARDPRRFHQRRLLIYLDALADEFGGGRAAAAPPPPLGRCTAEIRLYLDRLPCACGETAATWASVVVSAGDQLLARYQATCPRCGRDRVVDFRLPPEPTDSGPEGAGFRYGGVEPSELLDPGEWLAVADELARSVPALAPAASGAERERFRYAIGRAAAAIAEVAKFAPPGMDAVPAAAFVASESRATYDAESGRFRVDRLAAVRQAYLGLLTRAGLG
jgi:ribosomal protein S27AE